MQKLATVAAGLVSSPARSEKATMPTTTAPLAVPAIFDLLTDRAIPDRVVSYYEAPLNIPVLRRELIGDERSALERRADHLRASLAPFGPNSKKTVGRAISEMLRGFPQMQRRSPGEALDIIGGYLATLRERPAWAIVDACQMVRAGKDTSSVDFPPSEARLNQIVGEILAPYRARLLAAERLLGAKS